MRLTVLFSTEGQRNMAECGSTQQHSTRSCFKKGRTWAIFGGWGGPLGSTAKPPQTKAGGITPRHMAQFARIRCLEMWNSCPRHACSKHVSQVGCFYYVLIILHIAQSTIYNVKNKQCHDWQWLCVYPYAWCGHEQSYGQTRYLR